MESAGTTITSRTRHPRLKRRSDQMVGNAHGGAGGQHRDHADLEAEHGEQRGDGQHQGRQVDAARDRHVQASAPARSPYRNSANSVCSANQIARLRITPTTAAVIAASAADSALLPRRVSTKGAPRKIHRKQGTKVTQVVSTPPSAPASSGGRLPGLAEGAHEADELHDHDQRPGRRLGHAQAVQHLAGPQPAIGLDGRLGDIGQHRVGAAEGDHRHLGEEHGDLAEHVARPQRSAAGPATGPSQSTRHTAATLSDQASPGRACAGSSSPSAVSASATTLPLPGPWPPPARKAGRPARPPR